MYQAEQPGVGNKAIALKNCRNVTFRDFSILKGGHFGLLLTGVDNLTIDNLKIDTDRDGMDIDCCQNVRVSNCTVNSPWDDGICPKSSYALGYTRAHAQRDHHQLLGHRLVSARLGARRNLQEISPRCARLWHRPHQVRHRIQRRLHQHHHTGNCVFEGCLGYALESVDGALLEDITISNTTMRDLGCGPLFLRLGARLRGPKDTTKVGTLKRVLISNLECYNAPMRQSSILSGIPGSPD